MMDVLIIVLVATVSILFASQKAVGVDHTVQGWDLTAVNVSTDTRSKMVFSVGDGLVFKMAAGEADIVRVSKSDYEICRAEAPKAIYRPRPRPSSTETIYLNKTGNWFFISRVPDHCKSGNKLMITVVATSSDKSNNKSGFRFREAFRRMNASHKGGGSGVSGGGGGGGTPASGTPGSTDPLGNRNRVLPKKNGCSSTHELSAMVFKFQLVMSIFCSVLLASPVFV